MAIGETGWTTANHANGRSSVGAKTIDGALRILDLFNHAAPEWTVRGIAQEMDLPYSTAHRYVSTLEAGGYLLRHRPTGTYRIGLKLIELAGVALNQLDVRVYGLRDLDHLADETGLNANLAVLSEGDAFHIAYSVRSAVPRMYTALGRRAVAHCTALGKVLLADLPFETVQHLVESYGWRPYTERSIQSFPALRAELGVVRDQGHAVDRDERAVGVSCIAAPVRDKSGHVVAAICVTGPSEKFPDERLPDLVRKVKAHASSISYHLGYDDTDPS